MESRSNQIFIITYDLETEMFSDRLGTMEEILSDGQGRVKNWFTGVTWEPNPEKPYIIVVKMNNSPLELISMIAMDPSINHLSLAWWGQKCLKSLPTTGFETIISPQNISEPR